MNENAEITTGRAQRRGLGAFLAWLCAVLLGGLVIMVAFVYFSPQQRHSRVIRRIDDQVKQALHPLNVGSSPAEQLRGDQRTRAEVLMAVTTAIGNVMHYYQRCDAGKLRVIAGRLEQSNGAELQTGQGCLRLMADLEDACPDAREYVWFERVREMQAEGTVARLKDERK